MTRLFRPAFQAQAPAAPTSVEGQRVADVGSIVRSIPLSVVYESGAANARLRGRIKYVAEVLRRDGTRLCVAVADTKYLRSTGELPRTDVIVATADVGPGMLEALAKALLPAVAPGKRAVDTYDFVPMTGEYIRPDRTDEQIVQRLKEDGLVPEIFPTTNDLLGYAGVTPEGWQRFNQANRLVVVRNWYTAKGWSVDGPVMMWALRLTDREIMRRLGQQFPTVRERPGPHPGSWRR